MVWTRRFNFLNETNIWLKWSSLNVCRWGGSWAQLCCSALGVEQELWTIQTLTLIFRVSVWANMTDPWLTAGEGEQVHFAKVISRGQQGSIMWPAHGIDVGTVRSFWPDSWRSTKGFIQISESEMYKMLLHTQELKNLVSLRHSKASSTYQRC